MTESSDMEKGAATLLRMVGNWLESALGPGFGRPVIGPITVTDLVLFGLLILSVLTVNGIVVAWLRRRRRKSRIEGGASHWRADLFKAAGPPLYLLIWVYGLYFACLPLSLRLNQAEDESNAVQLLADRALGIGILAVLLWFAFRLTRLIDVLLQSWAARTSGKVDDLLAPLAGKSLRLIVPMLGLIFALPAMGLPAGSSMLLSKASSILVIVAIGWILIQAITVCEKLVLQRYDIKAADNLSARKIYTQVHVLVKAAYVIIGIFAIASVLMLFEEVRRFGTSLLASAGVIGVIAGFAAQRTIANLFAGFQLALTQPIRLDDVVIVEGEWGRIEEITLTYVVVRIWDDRRLVVPLSHFIEKPFQNWTRTSANILGSVFVWTDYSVDVEGLRPVVERIVTGCKNWDGRFWNLQVTDTNERAVQLRVLATASDASKAWDLRCELRERLLAHIQSEHPESLPRYRADVCRTSETFPQ